MVVDFHRENYEALQDTDLVFQLNLKETLRLPKTIPLVFLPEEMDAQKG